MISTIPAVGDRAEHKVYGPITRTDIVRYQGASGDFVPLHHDEGFARKAGFPTVFSVGMFQAGLLASFATDWLGPENLRRFSMRFEEQCWPGDVLSCAGEVVSVEAEDEHLLRLTVELLCTRQTGRAAITGSADFVLPTNAPGGLGSCIVPDATVEHIGST